MLHLKGGKDVPAQQMRSLLLPDEHALYEHAWREQRELRQEAKLKPEPIVEYERRLNDATFAYSKADAHSASGRSDTAKPMFDKSATKFERLWEYLAENIAGDHGLEVWFDRPVRYEHNDSTSLTPNGMPQVVTSKSHRNRSGGFLGGMRSKKQVKLDAIEAAIFDLNRDPDAEAELAAKIDERSKRLRKLLGD